MTKQCRVVSHKYIGLVVMMNFLNVFSISVLSHKDTELTAFKLEVARDLPACPQLLPQLKTQIPFPNVRFMLCCLSDIPLLPAVFKVVHAC